MRDADGADGGAMLHRVSSAPAGVESAVFPRALHWRRPDASEGEDGGGGEIRATLKCELEVHQSWEPTSAVVSNTSNLPLLVISGSMCDR